MTVLGDPVVEGSVVDSTVVPAADADVESDPLLSPLLGSLDPAAEEPAWDSR
jgi:hypothetical protein